MTDKQSIQVDINRATIEELVTIRGIGPNLADRIVEGRPYKEFQDLINVQGINEIKLAALLPYISLGKKPVRKAAPKTTTPIIKDDQPEPIAKVGRTEAFVFLENRNERQDAAFIVLGGFVLGLIILLIRRSRN